MAVDGSFEWTDPSAIYIWGILSVFDHTAVGQNI